MNQFKDRLLTERETADLLGLSLGKLRNDRSAGRGLRYVKLGRRGAVRYRQSDVIDYIEACLVEPEAELS